MAVRVGPFVCVVGAVGSSLLVSNTFAQQLAFPEAEGFGRFATGARTNLSSASVYHVTNLNDSGAGSFRDAVSQPNRFVVFDVGGIVNISSNVVVSNNVTIAGQTAPGGVSVFGAKVSYSGASNSITRYMAYRLGRAQGREDASGASNGANMMFDHMSITWGVDETFSFNSDGKGTLLDNISVQNSVIGQGLDVVGHSAAGLMTFPEGSKFSLIRNLFTDSVTRNPKVRGENEFINNVVYGWETAAYIMGDTTSMDSHANAIGNYFIEGPIDGGDPFRLGSANFHIYGSDNWVDTNKNGVLDGSLITNYPGADVVATPFAFPTQSAMSAQNALTYVLEHVGPSIVRDAVDQRLVDEVASYGTIGGVIVRETDLFPGYGTDPVYLNPRARLVDGDNDGINDNWERARNLNPANASDWKNLAGGYTQLENYLNELAGDGATRSTSGGAWTSAATWGGPVPNFADTAIVTGGLTHASGYAFARRATFDGTSTLTGGTLDVFDTVLVGAGANGTLNLNGTGISAGRVMIGAPGRTGSLTIGTGSTLQTATIQSAGGSGSLTFNGGAFKALGISSISVPVSVNASGGTINTNGFDGAITGNISGTGALAKTGNGVLTLSGNNSGFSGGINLNQGQLTLATNSSNSSTGVITLANATQLNITSSGASTPLAVANNATATLSAGGLTYNGAISGASGTTLQVNTSSGGTSNFSLGGSMSGFAGKLLLTGTGNIRVGSTGSLLADFDLGSSTGTVRTTFDNTVHFGSLIGGSSTRLQGSTNGTTASTYVIGANGKSTTFAGTITDGTNATPAKLNIAKTGTGTLTLAGANTYSGVTTVSGGVLSVASLANGGLPSNIGQSSAAAASLVLDGGTLRYTGPAVTIDRTFTLTQNGGTIDASGSNTLQFRNGGAPIALSGNGNRTLTLAGDNAGWNTLDRELDDPVSGTTSITKSGPGTWRLLNTISDYSGNTTVNGGTLIAWSGGTIPTGAGRGNVVVNGSGVLDLNGASHTINGLWGDGTLLHSANTRTLTLGNGDANGAFSGTFNITGGTLGVTKVGNGTQTLSGNLTYNGPTSIEAGKLVINGSLSSSTVTVNPGATLGGVASVPTLVVNAGSTVSPGNSIGTINVAGDVTLDGTLAIELSGQGTGSNDLLQVADTLDITGAGVAFSTLAGGLGPDGDVHVFATYHQLNGTFATVSGLPSGYVIDYDYNNGVSANNIALVPIPEPTSVGLLFGITSIIIRRRRVV